MENEKEYISTRAYNSLKKHAELIEETKKLVKVYMVFIMYIYNLSSFTKLIKNDSRFENC